MLVVDNLRATYGAIQALRGLTFSVEAGQIVALIGANGAGKSTLLRTISGLQPIFSGQVFFEDHDIGKFAAHRRVRLGIAQTPEGRQIFAPMTVEDNLRLGGYTRRQDGEFSADLDQMYNWFPILREKRKQTAGMLSGGQQQMLAIARSLMSKPKLLLLDEPSMGLAPIVVQEILQTIVRLRAQGITILLVEQNANAALAIADRAFVIATGKIVLSGTGEELLANDKVREAYLGA